MKHITSILCFIVLTFFIFFTACDIGQQPTAPEPQSGMQNSDLQSFENHIKWSPALRVMTRNIYIGADVEPILSAENPEDIPILVADTYQKLLATNFPERAVSLAREVALTRPHVIGLQEVTLLRIQSPGDAIVGGQQPAEDILMSYLDEFMATLKAFGLSYKVAAKIQNFDVELPMLTSIDPMTFDDIRVTDFDVVLIKKHIPVTDVVEKNYTINLFIPDLNIELPCGYCAISADIGSNRYRFVSTHLEAIVPEVRVAQAQELISVLQNETLPVVLLGDFNSPASGGEAYELITSAGYTDLWTLKISPFNPDGYTFGHDSDLRNNFANFTKRIDYIFARNPNSPPTQALAIVVGDEYFNRTESGMWASDHGGVVACFKLSPMNKPILAHM